MGTAQTGTDITAAGAGAGGRGWLTRDEQDAWRAYMATSKLLFRQLDRDLAPFGLNGNDYEILVVLSEAPEHRMRMTELADATAQSRSRLSHQITRMETAGLVGRDTCPGDRRGLYAVLTGTGMATIERVAPHHVESVRRHFIGRLTPGQQATLRDGYAVINEHLRQIRPRD
jgi:DNA-binding MarR family transcriptional regulator